LQFFLGSDVGDEVSSLPNASATNQLALWYH